MVARLVGFPRSLSSVHSASKLSACSSAIGCNVFPRLLMSAATSTLRCIYLWRRFLTKWHPRGWLGSAECTKSDQNYHLAMDELRSLGPDFYATDRQSGFHNCAIQANMLWTAANRSNHGFLVRKRLRDFFSEILLIFWSPKRSSYVPSSRPNKLDPTAEHETNAKKKFPGCL